MEKRKFGKTELEVSVLGFGGAEIGFNPHQTQQDVNLLLNSALDTGLNFVDTAAGYLKSEQMIGEALGRRRKEFYLASKCGSSEGFSREDWSKKGILETIEQSLRALKTDYLDLAQLHSCDTEILQRGDSIEGLQRAVEKGYTRYIGYSGDNEAAKYAVELDVFDALQISVNIADQLPIDEIIPLAVERGLGIIAKRPMANAVWQYREKPADSYVQEYWERLRKLKFEFLDKSPEEAAATALRFTMTVPGIDTMIVGTTRTGRWQENAKYVSEGNLSDAEFEEIRRRWQEAADDTWVGMT